MKNYKSLVNKSKKIRLRTLEIIYKAQKSNIGSCLSVIEILNFIYHNYQLSGKRENAKLILSKGQAAPAFYATLEEYRLIKKNSADSFRQINSKFQTHPYINIKYNMYASGSLGQGLSFGCGIALGLKLRNKKRKVFVLVGDGEMQEGQIWEALLFASHHKLNNLYLLIDKNNIQDFDFVDNIISLGQLSTKIKSFGFDVNTCEKGNNLKQINKSFVFKNSKKPKCIIFETVKGYGVKKIENKPEWSKSNSLNSKEYEIFKNEIKKKNFS